VRVYLKPAGENDATLFKHTGLVLPLRSHHIDTDQMVPKQFLKLQTKQGFGRVLFYDWRYIPGESRIPISFSISRDIREPRSCWLREFWLRFKPGARTVGRCRLRFRVLIARATPTFLQNCFKRDLPVTLPEKRWKNFS